MNVQVGPGGSRGVVAATVHEQARDPRHAMDGTKRQRTVSESNGRRGALVLERHGVGQTVGEGQLRETALHRVEVRIVNPLRLGAGLLARACWLPRPCAGHLPP